MGKKGPPEGVCGYEFDPRSLENRYARQSCCIRETLSDTDLCAWHADPTETDEKTIKELRETRASPENRKNVNNFPIEVLDGAVLSGMKLKDEFSFNEVSLRRSDLSGADLSSANLSDADLPDADLSGAYLSKADLSDAYLRRANLSNSTLRRADLSSAYLRSAKIVNASLPSVDLSEASLPSVRRWCRMVLIT